MLNYKPHPAILIDKDRFDKFFLGYTQCMGFTATEDDEEGRGNSLFIENGDFEEQCPESWNEWSLLLTEQERQEIVDDAVGFFLEAKDLILDDEERAGTDFSFTRNSHGSGFWDGEWEEHGHTLTEMSKNYGSQSLYGSKDENGKIISVYICH